MRQTITKKQLVEEVAKDSGVTVKVATNVINALFSNILGYTTDGITVPLKGFGKFERVTYKTGFQKELRSKIQFTTSRNLRWKATKSTKHMED